MNTYTESFKTFMGIKDAPNQHEVFLFERARKYIQILSKIPGIEMIAIVNSLSMYATHKDSDIDLFIITRPSMIWFVRFFSTMILWICGVWRKGNDIQGNFCLSFFITTDHLDLRDIAIDNDIYLYHWIYYMKPIYDSGGIYDIFIRANAYLLFSDEKPLIGGSGVKHCLSGDEDLKTAEQSKKERVGFTPETFGTFSHESTKKDELRRLLLSYVNSLIRFFFLPYTLHSYKKLGKPEGIIISDSMLKFHNTDRRREIRDTIVENNFDK